MKNLYFTLTFLLLCNITFSQVLVKGEVLDTLNSSLAYANIQVLDSVNVKIYGFTTTKNNGSYSIELNRKGIYIIKASFLGYESHTKKIVLDKEINVIDFVLQPKADELKEVIIKYDPKAATVKKDTIIYNLKKLTNGQENNLKEVLEKLPGISINKQGKVTAFGKKVGKLLIDGEDIFKEQHQFATENITADMIAGVTFFQKYKGFANIDGFNNDQTTAVNISIKDKFKQRITGNIEAKAGVLNKYLVHTNLFRLGKKLKVTLLGDLNNIGKESISFNDYIDLNTTVKSTRFGNSTTYDDNDIPTFLSSTRDVANREIGFAALNFIYSPKENLKISGYNIFNTTSQSQFFLNTRKFFQSLPDQTESNNVFGDFIFNTTQIKAAFRAGKSTFFQYTITNNPETDNELFDLSNDFNNEINTFDQRIRNVNKNIGQEVKVTTKISNTSLLEFSGYSQYKESNKNVSIKANNSFLGLIFLDNEFNIQQRSKFINRIYGYTLINKNKSKLGSYNFVNGFIHRNQDFNSQLTGIQETPTNNLFLGFEDAYIGGNFSSKKMGSFSYQLGLEYHYFFYDLNGTATNDRFSFFPSVGMNFRFRNNLSLSFNYSYQNEYPSLITQISNDVVFNYLNKRIGGFLEFEEVLPTHRIGSTISWTNFKKGDNFLFSLQYLDKPTSLTQNVIYRADNFTENEYAFTNIDKNYSILFDYNRSYNSLKHKFYLNTFLTLSKRGSYINNVENLSAYSLIEQAFKISSNFQKNINYILGVNLQYLEGKNSFNNIEFTSTSIDPYVGIRTSLLDKKMSFNLDFISKNLKAGDVNRSFFVLNPSIKYAKPKSHWEFSLTGNNILNLESPEIVDNVNNNVFFEERISRSLEGYLILGANYKF